MINSAQRDSNNIFFRFGKIGIELGNRGCIRAIEDLEKKVTISRIDEEKELWLIKSLKDVDSKSAEYFTCEHERDIVYLKWREFPFKEIKEVVASLSPSQYGGVKLKLMVTKAPSLEIREISYPFIHLGNSDSLSASLIIPDHQGIEVFKPQETLKKHYLKYRYPSPLSMQFFGYSIGRSGLVAFLDDSKGYVKELRISSGKSVCFTYFPPDEGIGSSLLTIPYSMHILPFDGNWMDAADKYRRWGLKQWWCRRGKIINRDDFPERLKEVVCWIWNRGRCDKVADPAIRFRHLAPYGRIGLMWHWWHSNPYDVNVPEYFPPRDGENKFIETVKELRERGFVTIVYVNARLWDTTCKSWTDEKAYKYATKNSAGELYEEHYNRFMDHPMAVMCPYTGFWRNKIVSMVKKLVLEYGVDGVYLDQIAAAAPPLCYDKEHGHSLGGGNYWVEGYRRIIEEIYREVKGDVILATEECSEAYLDLFHLFLVLDNSSERYGRYRAIHGKWRPIPLFNYVYNGYILFYGSYAMLTDKPPYDELWPEDKKPELSYKPLYDKELQFSLETSRALSWGCIPTIHNLTLEVLKKHVKEIKFFINLALMYGALRPYIFGGYIDKLCAEIEDELDIRLLKRSIYTLPHEVEVVKLKTKPVLISAWRLGDNRVILIINYTDKDSSFKLNGEKLKIPPRSIILYLKS